MSRVAVILFNLGGPDSPDAVRPFLFNLFNDPAIIGAPGPVRWLLARFISSRRAPVAREIYAHMGGASPILPNTEAAARAIETALADLGEVRCFPCMRYWHPRADAVAQAVKNFAPDEVVLLPQYPQYSTTTTGSSLKEWHEAARRQGLTARTRAVCCYPCEQGFITGLAEKVRAALQDCPETAPRVLFSAHGLPKKIVAGGDPYQWQVEQTVDALVAAIGEADMDWRLCYQSRVGPLEWIGPATEAEIEAAAGAGRALIVVPVGFVSEHSETLVELDIEYRELAEQAGAASYQRVDTVGVGEAFIAGQAKIVREILARPSPSLCAQGGGRICPTAHRRCVQAGEVAKAG